MKKYTMPENKMSQVGHTKTCGYVLSYTFSLSLRFFPFFLFIRDNTFVRFLCSLFLSSSLVNLMVLLYMSVRLIKKNIYVSYAEYNWNDKYIVFCELIGRKLKIAARHLCLNIILNRIDLVVDTYLANIMFDVIRILSGLTSYTHTHLLSWWLIVILAVVVWTAFSPCLASQ